MQWLANMTSFLESSKDGTVYQSSFHVASAHSLISLHSRTSSLRPIHKSPPKASGCTRDFLLGDIIASLPYLYYEWLYSSKWQCHAQLSCKCPVTSTTDLEYSWQMLSLNNEMIQLKENLRIITANVSFYRWGKQSPWWNYFPTVTEKEEVTLQNWRRLNWKPFSRHQGQTLVHRKALGK